MCSLVASYLNFSHDASCPPPEQQERSSSSSSFPWTTSHNGRSSIGELIRSASLENVYALVGSPSCIKSKVVNIVEVDGQTKLIGFEIPKNQEYRFDQQQFVAVYYAEKKTDVVEAGTFPIMSIKHNMLGAPIVYIAVRVDETHDPHSMATFLYEQGRPLLSANLVP
ncbi:expressed unknown protein [Seminavis robusta]|uniref:Uncharacterized protein n=1 Tax=Seminavis robusta TaxID=568900 RepID=A0A9N8DUX6_9STRA|nr:expressed unknown protein [Seminavis robusta]|eukprot:Sro370_g128340.1 n/a (167) ;mRNA; f:10363-10863